MLIIKLHSQATTDTITARLGVRWILHQTGHRIETQRSTLIMVIKAVLTDRLKYIKNIRTGKVLHKKRLKLQYSCRMNLMEMKGMTVQDAKSATPRLRNQMV